MSQIQTLTVPVIFILKHKSAVKISLKSSLNKDFNYFLKGILNKFKRGPQGPHLKNHTLGCLSYNAKEFKQLIFFENNT